MDDILIFQMADKLRIGRKPSVFGVVPPVGNYKAEKIVNLHVLAFRNMPGKLPLLFVFVHSPSCYLRLLVVGLQLIISTQVVAIRPSDKPEKTPHV